MQAIIFDCFGVLYVDASHHFYESHVPQYTELRPKLIELNRQADYGFITQAEQNAAVAELTGLSLKFVSEHIQGVHQRNAELMTYIRELRQHYKVAMLSNIGPASMDSFFSLEERRELFDAVVLSGEEGMAKPSPRIYELTAERLGVHPSQCLMIDDIEENCAGADAAGMKTILYTTNQAIISEISRL